MTRRDRQNRFTFAFSIASVLCFLFLPVYRIDVLTLSGWALLSESAVACLPLLFGLLTAVSSLLFPPRTGAVLSALAAAAVFALMLFGKQVLNLTAVVQRHIGVFVMRTVDISRPVTLQLSVGAGAILSLLLVVAALVAELSALAPKQTAPPNDRTDFDF